MAAAAQALDMRQGHRCGTGTQKTYDLIRTMVPALQEDRALGEDVSVLASHLESDFGLTDVGGQP
jgi:histidine ammonia-lyase